MLIGALLVGLPILDVTLVSLSRTRRGVSLLTGGRDHLTRILLAVRMPRRVAITQASLCACAVAGYELGRGGVVVFALAAFFAGMVAVLVLDTEWWRPAGTAMGSPGQR